MTLFLMALIGLVSGTLSGLLGIGGGIIMVPLFYYILGMDLTRAIGTSLFVIIPTAIAGFVTHWQLDHVDFKMGLFVALFAVIGGILGAFLTSQLSTLFLKKALAILLGLAAIKLFLDK